MGDSLVAGFDRLDLRDDEPSEVVLFDARLLPVEVPWTSPDGRLRILAGDRRHAVTSYRPSGVGGSNAGPTLQQLTGVKGTARGTGTMRRLSLRIRGADA